MWRVLKRAKKSQDFFDTLREIPEALLRGFLQTVKGLGKIGATGKIQYAAGGV